ncbi:MAG: hypothetical protein AAFR52_18755 [Pseudomonadota bacterium]
MPNRNISDDEEAGWLTMLSVIGVLGVVVLALLYFPELRPDEAVLDCDRQGGVWSSETGHCQRSDSPAAGLAA